MATIRAITLSQGEPHPLTPPVLARAASFLRDAQAQAEAEGHVVQTTRLACRPLLQDLDDYDAARLAAYATDLNAWCEAESVAFVSLGPAPAHQPAFDLDRLNALVDVLLPNPTLNATTQITYGGDPPRYTAALRTAEIMRQLAEASAGEANFRFAMLAMCEPGGPFFPQAYARGRNWTVSVGLQCAGDVGEALADVASRENDALSRLPSMEVAVQKALAARARPVVALVKRLAEAAGISYGGVDLSPAPMGNESIAASMERAGLGPFGSSGTLTLAATLTAAIKAAAEEVGPSCGYNGLMLPALEDATLGQRMAEYGIGATTLLAYSAVCGTGLDTIPLPGDTPPEAVARLLADVATLAWRLRKPLSARLFLAPGVAAGEMTRFTSPYLTNTRVVAL
ncbi:MAG TPA: DUF711 family protein [Ktedonobacterales bacterium]